MEKTMPIQQTPQYRPKRAMVLSLIVLAILFVALSLADAIMSIRSIDVRITDYIQTLKSPLLTSIAGFVSWFGMAPQAYLMLILTVAALFLARRRWEAVVLGVSSVFTIVLNVLVKIMVLYPGPTAPQPPELLKFADYTFPSGHVMFFMAFFWLYLLFDCITDEALVEKNGIAASIWLPSCFCRIFQSVSARTLDQRCGGRLYLGRRDVDIIHTGISI